MSYIKPLMDLKTFPAYAQFEIDCTNNRQKIVEEVATFVSMLYETFLKLNAWERNEFNKNIDVLLLGEAGVSESECKKFQVALKEKIIKALNHEKPYKRFIDLPNDHGPLEALREVAETVWSNEEKFHCLFPQKSVTLIHLRVDNQMKISMRFVKSCAGLV